MTDRNLYVYDPNKVLPAVAVALVGLSLIGHLYQNFRYKFWRVTFFMFYAGLFYTGGWIIRCISVNNPDNLALFMIQSILIYLAPPIYSAAEYNTLGRLMHYLPMHAVMNPNRVIYAFLFLGSLVEILTAIGGSWMAAGQGKDDQDLLKKGLNCISIAVILQALVEVFFIAVVAMLHHRCVRAKMLARNVRTIFIMLYGTSILILLRCVFRAVESFQLRDLIGGDGDTDAALLKHEWPMYALETLPVLIYTYWLNLIHPGRFLPSNNKIYLDFDGKTERVGPGWDNKRHWIMYLADPFDFIGMLTAKKGEAYYNEPDRWAKTKHSFAQGTASNARLED